MHNRRFLGHFLTALLPKLRATTTAQDGRVCFAGVPIPGSTWPTQVSGGASGGKLYGSFLAKNSIAVTTEAGLWQKVGRKIGFPVGGNAGFGFWKVGRHFFESDFLTIY
jgi:hypothetical protein